MVSLPEGNNFQGKWGRMAPFSRIPGFQQKTIYHDLTRTRRYGFCRFLRKWIRDFQPRIQVVEVQSFFSFWNSQTFSAFLKPHFPPKTARPSGTEFQGDSKLGLKHCNALEPVTSKKTVLTVPAPHFIHLGIWLRLDKKWKKKHPHPQKTGLEFYFIFSKIS